MKTMFRSLLFSAIILLSMTFTSCSKDDEQFGIIGSSDNAEMIIGEWYFTGNIAPSLVLNADGSCAIYYGSSSIRNDGTGNWVYEKDSRTLVCIIYNSDGSVNTSFTYSVKALTDQILTAEWSSVKYGTRTDTWIRK